MIKRIKIAVGILLICLIAYNSVYFEALDEKKLSEKKENFSPKAFAQELMQTQINNVPALEASAYFAQLDSNFNSFTKEHGKTLGVSNYRYFMVEGKGKVLAIEDENVRLNIEGLDSQSILLATDFIFGNTLRDASGLVSISDYANTMDFNNISVEMNHIVKNEIIPPFMKQVSEGQSVNFKGALRLNIEEKQTDELRVIPISLAITSKNP